jgi:hypothetical protein
MTLKDESVISQPSIDLNHFCEVLFRFAEKKRETGDSVQVGVLQQVFFIVRFPWSDRRVPLKQRWKPWVERQAWVFYTGSNLRRGTLAV